MNTPHDSGLYRLIDANADRTAEALRVVGDIARFILDDQEIAGRCKAIRSEFWAVYASVPGLQQKGLASRDSVGDVGREFPSIAHQDVSQVLKSNIHRAQESLRVLEEAFRSIDQAASQKISTFRYQCYDIEPPMMQAMDSWSLQQKLDFGLYVVLGSEFSNGRDFLEVAEKAMRGGAGAIQLRDKQMGKRELLQWAKRLRELTAQYGATFIINDHIDIALTVEADGIHLGQGDFPIAEARRIMGPRFIIGASTHSVDQAKQAIDEGCSYFNVGPVFSTQTKKLTITPVGLELVREISSQFEFPFTVMGGIKLEHVGSLIECGARRIAVVTAVVGVDDIEAAARAFCDEIAQHVKS
ncbi:MAG: thiamine phosphate synthase [Candidatus Hinthialibacter antarcticus]|nr:thiamine phosphate synthase [Candidatus Hinthialibacter antarcticus]